MASETCVASSIKLLSRAGPRDCVKYSRSVSEMNGPRPVGVPDWASVRRRVLQAGRGEDR
eukprot:scaffold87932_cov29-Tisochrysis_lutea.AAC.3